MIPTAYSKNESALHDLVDEFRSAIRTISGEYIGKAQNGDTYLNDLSTLLPLLMNGELEWCGFSSWCRFPVKSTKNSRNEAVVKFIEREVAANKRDGGEADCGRAHSQKALATSVTPLLPPSHSNRAITVLSPPPTHSNRATTVPPPPSSHSNSATTVPPPPPSNSNRATTMPPSASHSHRATARASTLAGHHHHHLCVLVFLRSSTLSNLVCVEKLHFLFRSIPLSCRYTSPSSGLVGSVLAANEGRVSTVSDFFFGAFKQLKQDDSTVSSSKPRNDSLLQQVNSLRQELQLLASNRPITIVTGDRSSYS
ncbi:hypothetical protein BUALT_Bualt19G0044400 [Buddleja alternifolia]|uniref:Uncharacterized protein n=1 Tax=Buddleja alternifolia TaxID=168488 RepID=A0AAV6W205_9LAMI|nr:hypothetical protein BUALT_Bualt19G0044400 [Buddleja alternifolia]